MLIYSCKLRLLEHFCLVAAASLTLFMRSPSLVFASHMDAGNAKARQERAWPSSYRRS